MKDYYIETLDYGVVYVKKSKSKLDQLVDLVQLVDGSYYEIYKRIDGIFIAIRLED